MLWLIAVGLVGLWCLGLLTGNVTGPLIHLLIAAAIILLIINIKQEISTYDELKDMSRAGKHRKVNFKGTLS